MAHAVPRPPYLTDAWLAQHGIADIDAVFAVFRSEDEVMAPASMRALKATRFSFARSLVRRMIERRWPIRLVLDEIDVRGAGTLIYAIEAEGVLLHFAVACAASDGTDKIGRFCESEFDFFASLLEGPVDVAKARSELAEMTSKVWSGRTDNSSLGWTVANRSNRFFDHAVDRLESGRQPDVALLMQGGGYIIRNAGWYGNGRHGSRSWLSLPHDHPLSHPYHVDIFALYMWRLVGIDAAVATAKARNSNASALSVPIQRLLGVGNSSGIGMVAALVRWPAWLSAFNFGREFTLAWCRTRTEVLSASKISRLLRLLAQAASYYRMQPNCPVTEIADPSDVAVELDMLKADLERKVAGEGSATWSDVLSLAAKYGPETREQFHSLVLDIEHDFADSVATLLPRAFEVGRTIQPSMTVGTLRAILDDRYGWALAVDRSAPGATEYFWYRSEDNGENRRGERAVDPGVEHETFVDVVGAIQELRAALAGRSADDNVASFLLDRPDLAHAVSRAQLATRVPYGEIRGNVIAKAFLPMDGIRFLLSTMGLEASHPHNTRWVRGVFLQGAPLPADLEQGTYPDDWTYAGLADHAASLTATEADRAPIVR